MSTVEVRKKEGETATAMLFRFSRRIKRSGKLKESSSRRFLKRTPSKRSRRVSALHREQKRGELAHAKKMGLSS